MHALDFYRQQGELTLYLPSFSFNSASLSSNSQSSSSVNVFFFFPSLIFFSMSLMAFFASLALRFWFALTSILLPAPSYTSLISLGPAFFSSVSSPLDSPSMRRYPPFMIHFSVATLSQNSLLCEMIRTPPL